MQNFFIHVPSSAQGPAENTPSSFTVLLPDTLSFEGDDWEVGLASITYTNAIERQDRDFTLLIRSLDGSEKMVHIPKPETPEQLIQSLNNPITRRKRGNPDKGDGQSVYQTERSKKTKVLTPEEIQEMERQIREQKREEAETAAQGSAQTPAPTVAQESTPTITAPTPTVNSVTEVPSPSPSVPPTTPAPTVPPSTTEKPDRAALAKQRKKEQDEAAAAEKKRQLEESNRKIEEANKKKADQLAAKNVESAQKEKPSPATVDQPIKPPSQQEVQKKKEEADRQAVQIAEELAKKERDQKAAREAEERAKVEDERIRKEKEEREKREREERERIEEEENQKRLRDAQEAERKEKDEKARIEAKRREEEEIRLKVLEDERVKAESDRLAREQQERERIENELLQANNRNTSENNTQANTFGISFTSSPRGVSCRIDRSKVHSIRFSPALSRALGFPSEIYDDFTSTKSMDWSQEIYFIFIEADCASPSIVGNNYRRLLRIIPHVADQSIVDHAFNPIIYYPLAHRSIESVSIQLYDGLGRLLVFNHGEAICVLNFRKCSI